MQEAERSYQAALNIKQRLVAAHPKVIEYQEQLANTHQNLGKMYYVTGRMKDAERSFQAALDLRQKLAATHPDIVRFLTNLVRAYNALGGVYHETGRLSDAERSLQAAPPIRRSPSTDATVGAPAEGRDDPRPRRWSDRSHARILGPLQGRRRRWLPIFFQKTLTKSRFW